jgi:hypothetical protein
MPTAEAVRPWDRETMEIEQWPQRESEQTEAAEDEKLKAKIDQARKAILGLADDWDGEGSQSYSCATFDRAVTFLTAHSDYLRQFGLDLPIPSIGPGPGGSIDLHWKRASWELLVNIPADVDKMASFYGDNYGVQKIKGNLDPKTYNTGLAAWLMN